MLLSLHIENIAVARRVDINPGAGFTVLTGETGAGKSILIGAISFLLGGKSDVSQIRTGAQEARVSGTILLSNAPKDVFQWLSEHGAEPENDRVLLRRIIRDTGKSSAWIQDVPVTKTELNDFTSYLVDIHGQHEHQSLMRVSEHRKFLDSYAGITAEVTDFTALFNKLVEKRRLLDEMNSSDSARAEKIELLHFALDEIEKAKLNENEEDELSAEETRLTQYEKLYGDIESVCDFFQAADGGLLSGMKKIRNTFERTVSIDSSLEKFQNRLENAYYELEDIADEIKNYKNTLVFDADRLAFVQERLALIYKLKQKYLQSSQGTVADLLAYAENAAKQLVQLENWQGNREELVKEVSELEKQVYTVAKALSEKRTKAASVMADKIVQVLAHLGMRGTQFDAGLKQKPVEGGEQKCGPYGFDDIEFMISANPGSPLQPLAKIASGGELSRVMLAFKTILADTDTTPTLIFDEIDTGIGGEVAVSVGEHLRKLSEKHQILCISHLANIAVCADTHIKIEKSVSGQKTTTQVFLINGQKRIEEIARMLAGDSASEASLEHAKTLLAKYGG
ncbi:MAG: DNA repair protein RecN [Spirochaetaceae bacterium]|nr:DNA repair protein RecN [Spirochaetaceae bacterium]